MKRLLLIVGVQKSGTTLLARLLQESGLAVNPFRAEGDDFWGNEPPLAPTGTPAGAVYQRSGGAGGHVIDGADATAGTRDVLGGRLAALDPGDVVVLNKNPYNTVRLPWLRALFPDAVIVAVVRRPAANVYSLAKKYVPHRQRGLEPDAEGWWGVKPHGWRALKDADKVVQSARQWAAVNARLWSDRALVDRLVAYHDLCARPGDVLADLHARVLGGPPPAPYDVPPLACLDHEHERGARLRSKNRYFRERGDLTVPADEPPEFPPLAPEQVRRIQQECDAVLTDLGSVLG